MIQVFDGAFKGQGHNCNLITRFFMNFGFFFSGSFKAMVSRYKHRDSRHLSMDIKNVENRVETKKLWPFEVGVVRVSDR